MRGSLSLKGRGSCTKIVARSAPLLFGERVRVRGYLSLKGRGSCTKIVARSAPLLFGERVRVRGSLFLKDRGIRTTIVARSAPSPLWGEGWGEGFPLPQEQRDPHKKERHGRPPLLFGERVGVRGTCDSGGGSLHLTFCTCLPAARERGTFMLFSDNPRYP